MDSQKKGLSIILVLCLLGLVLGTAWRYGDGKTENGYGARETLYLWYTDAALEGYINSAALAFYEDTGVRVVPVLHSGLEYLEELNEMSVSGNQVPDLYILGSDSLEKAAMAGLAIPVEDGDGIISTRVYPQVALDAVTYQGEKFAYPFYFETAFLLYNESYLEEMAAKMIWEELEAASEETEETTSEEAVSEEAEESEEETEALATVSADSVPEGMTPQEWEEMLQLRVEGMIPSTIEDILAFADQYDAPENVENIFLWDVTDIFYNYFFSGAYMNVGGVHGDDETIIEIYNEDTIECLTVYQRLHQFFSIESKESSYEQVLNSFVEGKTIFTIATTDAIEVLENAENRSFTYGVAMLPGIDASHEAGGLSTTSCVVINGYSENASLANEFAGYLVYDYADTLYERTHKMPAVLGQDDYVEDVFDRIRAVYRESVPLPKILEISNFWIQVELAYTRIWDGADVNETLRLLSEQMKTQIAGTPVTEDVITVEIPEEEVNN